MERCSSHPASLCKLSFRAVGSSRGEYRPKGAGMHLHKTERRIAFAPGIAIFLLTARRLPLADRHLLEKVGRKRGVGVEVQARRLPHALDTSRVRTGRIPETIP